MPILPLYSVPACPKCDRIRSKKGAKLPGPAEPIVGMEILP